METSPLGAIHSSSAYNDDNDGRYGNILRLIAFWQDFEKHHERKYEGTEAGLEEFSIWMQQQLGKAQSKETESKKTESTSSMPILNAPTDAGYAMAIRTAPASNNATIPHQPTDADGMISILLGRMGRYAKLYTKKALDGHSLASLDEFVLLAAITQYERTNGEPTKSEVYAATLTEVTTGSEIMRRLDKAGLVEECADTKDKRMKRVRLTPHGKEVFFQAAQQMGEASHIVAGTLSAPQKAELIHLLTLLDTFHSAIYTGHRMEPFDKLRLHAKEQQEHSAASKAQ